MEKRLEMFEVIYRRLMIEFQREMDRPLLEDEKSFIKWISKKAIEEYLKNPTSK